MTVATVMAVPVAGRQRCARVQWRRRWFPGPWPLPVSAGLPEQLWQALRDHTAWGAGVDARIWRGSRVASQPSSPRSTCSWWAAILLMVVCITMARRRRSS